MSRDWSGGKGAPKRSRQKDTSTQFPNRLHCPACCVRFEHGGPQHPSQSGQPEPRFQGPLGPCLHTDCPTPTPATKDPCPCALMSESECNLNRAPGFGKRGCRPTLLGCTARRRFSIHLSRSAADRQEKHLLPDDVVTCGGQKGPCHRGEEHGQAGHDQGPLRLGGASATGSAAQPQGGRTKRRMTPSFRVCGRCTETTVPGTGRWPSPAPGPGLLAPASASSRGYERTFLTPASLSQRREVRRPGMPAGVKGQCLTRGSLFRWSHR